MSTEVVTSELASEPSKPKTRSKRVAAGSTGPGAIADKPTKGAGAKSNPRAARTATSRSKANGVTSSTSVKVKSTPSAKLAGPVDESASDVGNKGVTDNGKRGVAGARKRTSKVDEASKAVATSVESKPASRHGVEVPVAVVSYEDNPTFLQIQLVALQSERATYLEQANSLRAEAESLIEEMEPGDVQFDEESGEGGTVTVDRERDLALSAQALAAVEEIDAAIRKVSTGRYGICEGCGQLIVEARLEALPYARLCVACKSGGLSRR